MSKKPAKPAAATDTAEAPKKRSKLKLAIFALVPLLLAGGGYAGYTQFLARPGGEAAEGEHGAPEADPVKVSAVPTEIAAETSFTHSFALSVLLAQRCGGSDVPALQAASEAEAHADGMLVSLSWQAAARRVGSTTAESCGILLGEIDSANAKAKRVAGGHAAPEAGKAPAHH